LKRSVAKEQTHSPQMNGDERRFEPAVAASTRYTFYPLSS
jgi:hypothetical protein